MDDPEIPREIGGDPTIPMDVSAARTGLLRTPHGDVRTPVFLPVASKGSLKTLDGGDMRGMDLKALILNSYLLSNAPGMDIISEHGGIHRFMDFDGCVFSDSGGFQMIRSDFLQGIDDSGASFRSPRDGRKQHLTPEDVIDSQLLLGSDVLMPLDHCPPHDADPGKMDEAHERTLSWYARSREHFMETLASREHGPQLGGPPPKETDEGRPARRLLFGISQGGCHRDMRVDSIERLMGMGIDGLAIGGLSIGETREDMLASISHVTDVAPDHIPRYFMGLGTPLDILECVDRGVDIFDSVYPSRNARHGTAITSDGTLNIGNRRFKEDMGPLDVECDCPVCTRHTRSYVHHLFREKELSGMRLLTLHNLHFYLRFIEAIRSAIEKGGFRSFKSLWEGRFTRTEQE